jgi:L-threonylcarbamoyladenylate synthase
VDLILDGGPSSVGIESTVLSLVDRPVILRRGAVTRDMIERVLGEEVPEADTVAEATSPLTSPGQQADHYATRTPALRIEPSERARIDLTDAAIIEPTLDPETYARNIYARLRMLDQQNLRAIFIEMPPDAPPWAAVRDRIVRATKPLP